MIPHANDDCRLTASDPEELKLLVGPGRKHSIEDFAAAVVELKDHRLIGQDDKDHYFFPAAAFYQYQTVIPKERRAETPPLGAAAEQRETPQITADHRETAPIAAEQRETPQNTASFSLSSNSNFSFSESAGADSSRARAQLVVDNDLGLGEKHPAMLCGWDRWRRLEQFWKSEGKRLGIFQVECLFKQLDDIRKSGNDPGDAVEKSLRCGWKDVYPPDKEPPSNGGRYDRSTEPKGFAGIREVLSKENQR